jgi:hypothetical protein
MIHKGNVPSIQCEMNLRWSKSMGEVHGPSFIFIYFNGPAHLSWIQTALQLSENITLFVIHGIHRSLIGKEGQINTWCFSGGGIIYVHCVQCWGQDGTLRHSCLHFPWSSHYTFNQNSEFCLREKRANKLDQTGLKFKLSSLYSKPGCHVMSKAFLITKNTTAIDTLLNLTVTRSISLIHCIVMLWHARKPNWLALSRPLTSVCLSTIFIYEYDHRHNSNWKRLFSNEDEHVFFYMYMHIFYTHNRIQSIKTIF